MNQHETQKAIESIHDAAETCSPSIKKIGLIGFSSGGYMTMKIFRSNFFQATKPTISWGIAAGSGLMNGPIEPEPRHLAGILTLIIGKQDKYNFDPQQNYYNLLKKKSDHVQLIEFVGTHELPLNETLNAIRNQLHLSELDP